MRSDSLKSFSQLSPDEQMECKRAEEEYVDIRKKLNPFFCSREEFEKSFNQPNGQEGAHVTNYFDFLVFIILNNFVMSIWALIGWIPHIRNIMPRLDRAGRASLQTDGSTYNQPVEVMFLSTYQPSSDDVWTAMVVLGSLTMLSSGPLYYFLLARSADQLNSVKPDDSTSQDGISIDDRTMYYDEYKTREGNRKVRRMVSYACFVIVCLVPAGINYGLLYVANHRALQARM
jgi:hypothetical protein